MDFSYWRTLNFLRNRRTCSRLPIENVHPHDIGTILDQSGIAIRAGHHCAQPVMKYFEVPATARASFAFYDTREEVDVLADSIQKVIDVFA
jgi:cysteine desulfurase/selenocysteine lyase